MKVILFGASGMVGQGVLRECLLDPRVKKVLGVGRSASGSAHEKLGELVLSDLSRIADAADALQGYDACFFCLGVSSAGMTEQRYTEITFDLTLAVANTLVALNPGMTFIYVSGAGTDSGEQGRSMWARVKGRTENALLLLPFRAAFMFRPGAIQPLHGIRSKTRLYQLFYTLTGPLLPLLKRIMPGQITTTEQVGRAMIELALYGGQKRVLETPDINSIRRT
jgi:uncharacterized protein YbjT (DUF2867 family)